jgi:single-strand DNA-binding protein
MNSITLLGRLGKDPEVKFLNNGNAVAKFSLATTRKWKDKQTGEAKEKTEWHQCTAWGKTGELIAEYFSKGDMILLEGALEYNEWEKEGVKITSAQINVSGFHFVGSKGDAKEAPQKQAPRAPSQQQEAYGDDVPF